MGNLSLLCPRFQRRHVARKCRRALSEYHELATCEKTYLAAHFFRAFPSDAKQVRHVTGMTELNQKYYVLTIKIADDFGVRSVQSGKVGTWENSPASD